MAALLPMASFSPIFSQWTHRRVGFVPSRRAGNVGDRLIDIGTRKCLNYYNGTFIEQEPEDDTDAELLYLFGGGNFGHPESNIARNRRQRALASGKQCVVLPQTIYSNEAGSFRRVFCREHTSLPFRPSAQLAPDLAFAVDPVEVIGEIPKSTKDHGLFLSKMYPECMFAGYYGSLGDPRTTITRPADYLNLAAQYRTITTDILHLSICGLMLGRKVKMLPTTRHKNWGMWFTWLRHFGAYWGSTPDDGSEWWKKYV